MKIYLIMSLIFNIDPASLSQFEGSIWLPENNNTNFEQEGHCCGHDGGVKIWLFAHINEALTYITGTQIHH